MKPQAHLTEVTYVNIHGQPVSTVGEKIKRPPPDLDSFHKGFRVTGFSPEHLEQAMLDHAEKEDGKPWCCETYIRNHNGKPVRSKPYQIREAAQECAELAAKSGWLGVQVVEVKREVQKKAFA